MVDEPRDVEGSEAEGTPAEGSDAAPAGPGAGEGTSPSQAAGEEPTPTPPAEEASEGEPAGASDEVAEQASQPGDEAAAETPDTSEAASQSDSSPPSEEAPEAEQGEVDPAAADAERSTRAEGDSDLTPPEEAEGPAGDAESPERKRDVIPGADLEPIAVEPEERPLSAEEQARLEAEEEERRQREAALTGEPEEEERAASRAPARLEGDARYLATGKRKHSIARVTLLPGNGKFEVNRRPLDEFFPRPLHQTMARQPLTTTGYEGSVDVRVRVRGGGISGQAGAVRHGIARALTEIDPELRGELKRRGLLTRDARAKERRKAGLKKARKRPQFSKR
jgi:small subunit ribosomal protein S9